MEKQTEMPKSADMDSRSPNDPRKYRSFLSASTLKTLKPTLNLIPSLPPVVDQSDSKLKHVAKRSKSPSGPSTPSLHEIKTKKRKTSEYTINQVDDLRKSITKIIRSGLSRSATINFKGNETLEELLPQIFIYPSSDDPTFIKLRATGVQLTTPPSTSGTDNDTSNEDRERQYLKLQKELRDAGAFDQENIAQGSSGPVNCFESTDDLLKFLVDDSEPDGSEGVKMTNHNKDATDVMVNDNQVENPSQLDLGPPPAFAQTSSGGRLNSSVEANENKTVGAAQPLVPINKVIATVELDDHSSSDDDIIFLTEILNTSPTFTTAPSPLAREPRITNSIPTESLLHLSIKEEPDLEGEEKSGKDVVDKGGNESDVGEAKCVTKVSDTNVVDPGPGFEDIPLNSVVSPLGSNLDFEDSMGLPGLGTVDVGQLVRLPDQSQLENYLMPSTDQAGTDIGPNSGHLKKNISSNMESHYSAETTLSSSINDDSRSIDQLQSESDDTTAKSESELTQIHQPNQKEDAQQKEEVTAIASTSLDTDTIHTTTTGDNEKLETIERKLEDPIPENNSELACSSFVSTLFLGPKKGVSKKILKFEEPVITKEEEMTDKAALKKHGILPCRVIIEILPEEITSQLKIPKVPIDIEANPSKEMIQAVETILIETDELESSHQEGPGRPKSPQVSIPPASIPISQSIGTEAVPQNDGVEIKKGRGRPHKSPLKPQNPSPVKATLKNTEMPIAMPVVATETAELATSTTSGRTGMTPSIPIPPPTEMPSKKSPKRADRDVKDSRNLTGEVPFKKPDIKMKPRSEPDTLPLPKVSADIKANTDPSLRKTKSKSPQPKNEAKVDTSKPVLEIPYRLIKSTELGLDGGYWSISGILESIKDSSSTIRRTRNSPRSPRSSSSVKGADTKIRDQQDYRFPKTKNVVDIQPIAHKRTWNDFQTSEDSSDSSSASSHKTGNRRRTRIKARLPTAAEIAEAQKASLSPAKIMMQRLSVSSTEEEDVRDSKKQKISITAWKTNSKPKEPVQFPRAGEIKKKKANEDKSSKSKSSNSTIKHGTDTSSEPDPTGDISAKIPEVEAPTIIAEAEITDSVTLSIISITSPESEAGSNHIPAVENSTGPDLENIEAESSNQTPSLVTSASDRAKQCDSARPESEHLENPESEQENAKSVNENLAILPNIEIVTVKATSASDLEQNTEAVEGKPYHYHEAAKAERKVSISIISNNSDGSDAPPTTNTNTVPQPEPQNKPYRPGPRSKARLSEESCSDSAQNESNAVEASKKPTEGGDGDDDIEIIQELKRKRVRRRTASSSSDSDIYIPLVPKSYQQGSPSKSKSQPSSNSVSHNSKSKSSTDRNHKKSENDKPQPKKKSREAETSKQNHETGKSAKKSHISESSASDSEVSDSSTGSGRSGTISSGSSEEEEIVPGSEADITNFKKMAIEMKRTKPNVDYLNWLLDKTRDYRKRFLEATDYDVDDGLKKFPALQNYQAMKSEFDKLNDTGTESISRMEKLEARLQKPMDNVLNSKKRPGQVRHEVWEKAQSMMAREENNFSTVKKNTLRMICLCFHLVEDYAAKKLFKITNEVDNVNWTKISTPELVILDKELFSEDAKDMWIYAEGLPHLKVPNFYEGVLTIFAMHFVFNIVYDSHMKTLFKYFEELAGIN